MWRDMLPVMDLSLLLLFAAGLAAGVLNILAGGGSFLTLPVLILFGLPAGEANATNRVGIVMQNIAAVWSFDRAGVLDRGAFLWAVLPALPGSVLGTLGVTDPARRLCRISVSFAASHKRGQP